MLIPEVKERVEKQITIVKKKLEDIDSTLEQGKKDLAVYWLFSIYENIAEAIQDIKDNKKEFEQVKNHALKINILKLYTKNEYADCLEKLNKAKNIGAYGSYADRKYSAPITDKDVTDCYNKAKSLLDELKELVKK
ncbi:MAG: hypothetical protein KAT43_01390 [Nanoarchaeota archaeon]|nr:hypothetical protein [Nanoarchaeota archaeon]